jgi:urease accessory protein
VDASIAVLAGRRVLVTEFLHWGADPESAVCDEWWSLVPLAAGGSLVTVLAPDAIAAAHWADQARAAHPGWSDLSSVGPSRATR